eukprot:3225648-Rhodomonas_salina.1
MSEKLRLRLGERFEQDTVLAHFCNLHARPSRHSSPCAYPLRSSRLHSWSGEPPGGCHTSGERVRRYCRKALSPKRRASASSTANSRTESFDLACTHPPSSSESHTPIISATETRIASKSKPRRSESECEVSLQNRRYARPSRLAEDARLKPQEDRQGLGHGIT